MPGSTAGAMLVAVLLAGLHLECIHAATEPNAAEGMLSSNVRPDRVTGTISTPRPSHAQAVRSDVRMDTFLHATHMASRQPLQAVRHAGARRPELSWPWSMSDLPHEERWWGPQHLQAGVKQPTRHEQMAAVLWKLRHRQGIVVAAIGSSVVVDFAGCWPLDDTSSVKQLVNVPPHVYQSGHCQDPLHRVGWGSAFMELLQARYPGNDNVMINAGRGALPLWGWVEAGCFEENLPAQRRPDLILIENHEPTSDFVPVQYTEKVIWRLLLHPHGAPATQATPAQHRGILPAVVMVNVIDSPPPVCGGPECGVDMMEDELMPMLEYYGFAAVSTRDVLRTEAQAVIKRLAGMEDPQVMKQTARDEMVQRSESVNIDHVHPSRLGQVLLADLLATYVFDADANLSSGAGALRWGGSLPQPRLLPAKRFFVGGRDVPTMRCYGHQQDNPSKLDTEDSAKLNILDNKGFTFSLYQVHGNSKKIKPGWTALNPGSFMTVRINTAFDKPRQLQHMKSGKYLPEVTLLMLHSYEHMGQFRVSCVSGCTCESKVFDLHETSEHTSLTKTHSFSVTQHRQCDLHIEVLETTSSGEHKVKLIQIVAKIHSQDTARHH